ncbi:MAG: hypothetical protein IKG11_08305 [Atopobiaceae bacterium]|nr:hypothetical protein [Atopobiaceae bacterium]
MSERASDSRYSSRSSRRRQSSRRDGERDRTQTGMLRERGRSRSRSGSQGRYQLEGVQRRDSERRRRGSSSARRAPRTPGIPVRTALIALLVGVLVTFFLTFCTMRSKVKEAQTAAKDAQTEVVGLQSKVTSLQEQLTQLETAKANEGVESPWTKTGRFTSGDATLDKYVKTFCDKNSDTSMTQDKAAFEVYKAIAWSDYVERDAAQDPRGEDWRIVFAKQYYENDQSGNCYEYASFISYCLQYLGFTDAIAQGVEIEMESGSWGDHGIVYVTNTDGTECIIDTARGTNGWMISPDTYNMRLLDFESKKPEEKTS